MIFSHKNYRSSDITFQDANSVPRLIVRYYWEFKHKLAAALRA